MAARRLRPRARLSARRADAGAAGRARRAVWPTVDVVVTTYQGWRDDRCIRLGAGLAYYGLFAIVPVLSIAIALADVVFQADDVEAFLTEPLARLFGEDAEVVAARIAAQFAESSLAASLGPVGVVSTFVAASLVFVAFQDALNEIWDVPYQAGIRHTFRRRLLAFGVVFATGGVIITSLAVQAVVALVGDLLPLDHPLIASLTEAVSRLVPVAVSGVALAVLFVLMVPDRHVDRRAAAVAGGTTAVSMAAGAVLIGAYLARFGAGSASQAAGSVFVVMAGIYAECQILLAGVELCKALSIRWSDGRSPVAGDAGGVGVRDDRRD